MNKIFKLLPALILLIVISIVIILHSNSSLPTFKFEELESVDISKISEIVKMLEDDNKKGNAQKELDTLYQGKNKDDIYYLTQAKIVMETGNDVEALSPLNNVKNKTIEYYGLRVRAAAGEYFTYGNVPNGLLNTTLEAASKYSDNIDFQLLAGKLYYDKDNYTASLYYLDKALQIDEDNVDANYYYALCIYLLGEQEEGINYMKKAQSLYKGDDKVYKESMTNYIDLMKEGKR